MTLKTLTDEIARLGIEQKCINYSAAGSSIYQLNPKQINSYPILFQAPTGDHLVTDNYTRFAITLYYLDRLTEDSINDIVIFSASIEQLKNLIRGIETIEDVLRVDSDYTISNFSDGESFDDRLAGAYCTINVTVKNNETCYEI